MVSSNGRNKAYEAAPQSRVPSESECLEMHMESKRVRAPMRVLGRAWVSLALTQIAMGCGDAAKQKADPVLDAGARVDAHVEAPTTEVDAAAVVQLMPRDPLTVEQYCEALDLNQTAWADWKERCCEAADTAVPTPFFYESVAECVEFIQTRIDDQKVVFHGEYAEQCAEESRAHEPPAPDSCATPKPFREQRLPSKVLESCTATFGGLVALGGSCHGYIECDDGLFCSPQGSGSSACFPLREKGKACVVDSECQNGLFCVGGKCTVRLAKKGEACGYDSDCKPGLRCNDSGKCADYAGWNRACQSTADCPDGMYCDGACEYLANDGDACEYADQCRGKRCDAVTRVCSAACGEPVTKDAGL